MGNSGADVAGVRDDSFVDAAKQGEDGQGSGRVRLTVA